MKSHNSAATSKAPIMTALTKKECAYLNELAADIAANEKTVTLESISAAQQRRRDFFAEMLARTTPRARMARVALCVDVFTACTKRKALGQIAAINRTS